jgi:hypothetical protein
MQELQVVDARPRCDCASLVEPSHTGYLYIAAQVRPSTRPGPARLTRARNEAPLLGREGSRLAARHPEWNVDLFRAAAPVVAYPHARRPRQGAAK